MQNWAVVCRQDDNKTIQQFVLQLMQSGPQVGLIIRKPEIVSIPDDRVDSYIRALRRVIDNRNTQIVMVIFRMARTDKYSAVKKLCCIENPIPSQVCLFHLIQ